MKEDEMQFLIDVYKSIGKTTKRMIFGKEEDYPIKPRDIINQPEFYINYKRAWYLLGKWCDKGWYDFGVSLDLGWLNGKGIEIAKKILGE